MPTWLTPKCPACADIGAVVVYRRDEDPAPPDVIERRHAVADGTRYYLCRCPVCGAGRLSAYLRKLSQVPETLLDMTLDFIRDDIPSQQAAYRACRVMYGQPAGWLTLWGSAGVGKTTLIIALLNALRDRYQMGGIYTTGGRLLDSLRAGYDDDENDTARRIAELESIAVLAVDEIDGCQWTPWATEKMGDLLNARYMARGSKVTLIGANEWETGSKPPVIPAYIRSRAADAGGGCVVIHVVGPDLRRG